jgi:ribosomal small subunit protein bTHX
MGKGDRRSKRGKIAKGSFGKTRSRKKKKTEGKK